MDDLSREIQRADAMVTREERAQSSILKGAEKVREQVVDQASRAGSESQALLRVNTNLAVMDYADRVAETPGLKEEAAKEIARVREALGDRELPPGARRDTSVGVAAAEGASTAAVIQAAVIQGERADDREHSAVERFAAEALARELELRRQEMLRGARRSEEFRYDPSKATSEQGEQLAAQARAEAREREANRANDHAPRREPETSTSRVGADRDRD